MAVDVLQAKIRKLKKTYEARIPQKIYVTQSGAYSPTEPLDGMGYMEAVFVPSPPILDSFEYSDCLPLYMARAVGSYISGEGTNTASIYPIP